MRKRMIESIYINEEKTEWCSNNKRKHIDDRKSTNLLSLDLFSNNEVEDIINIRNLSLSSI